MSKVTTIVQQHRPSSVKTATIRQFLFLLLLGAAFFAAPIHSQERYLSGLIGTVSDSTGANIVAATVTATDDTTHFVTKVTTDGAGSYNMPFLTPDTYTVTVETSGFRTETRTNVVLTAGNSLALNFSLRVGRSTQTVMVNATSGLLDTATASLGTAFTQKEVAELPSLGRVPFLPAALAAGAYNSTYLTGTVAATLVPWGGGPTAITMNGISGHTRITIDGTPDDPLERIGTTGGNTYSGFEPSPESVQEVKSETAPYDAEFGDGAGNENLVLRSGTNDLHGAAYFVFQNTYLNANDYQRVPDQNLTGSSATPRGNGTWNEPGGVLAGPVRIPHLYNGHDKTFFMVAYEHIELHGHTASGVNDFVPVPAMANGDFSSLCPGGFNSSGVCNPGGGVQIYDPLTLNAGNNRSPFPYNQIPSSRFSSYGSAMLKDYPAPNSNLSSTVNYISTYSVVPESYWSFITRVDQSINQNNKFFAVLYKQDLVQAAKNQGFPTPNIGPTGSTAQVYRNNEGGSLDYISLLPHGFVLDARLGILYHPFGDYPSLGTTFDLSNIGVSPTGLAYQTFPGTSFSDSYAGFQGTGAAGGQFSEDSFGTFVAVVSKNIGTHNLRFGFEGAIHRYNQANPMSGLGVFAYDRTFTQENSINTPVGKDPNSGNPIAALLLGYPTSGSYQVSHYPAIQQPYQAYFVQDDWRAARKLTINAGLRWDDQMPYTDRDNALNTGFCTACVNPLGNSVSGLNLYGGLEFASSTNRQIYQEELRDWQPRLGLSYQLNRRIVLHSGWGITYFNSIDGLENVGYTAVTDYADTVDGTHPATSMANPFPGGVLQPSGNSLGLATGIGSNLSFIAPNYHRPKMMLYSASVQAQLPLNMMLQVAYAGNRVWYLETSKNINALPAQYLLPASASIAAQQANVTALTTKVSNPMAGQIPTNATLNSATIQQQYLDYPFPEFGTLTELDIPNGGNLYNALQVTVNKPMGHNVSVLGTFSWNKNMDSTNYLNATDTTPERWQDGNPTLIGNLAVIYQLPSLSALPRYAREILGGWQANGILRATNGPLVANPGSVTWLSSAKLAHPTMGRYFDTCYLNDLGQPVATKYNANGTVNIPGCDSISSVPAFEQHNSDILNNSGPDMTGVRDPIHPIVDVSMFKVFKLHESQTFEIRGEFFNALNTPFFGGPGTTPGSANYGEITPTQDNDPRIGQLTARFNF
jgi:hypothetical protein